MSNNQIKKFLNNQQRNMSKIFHSGVNAPLDDWDNDIKKFEIKQRIEMEKLNLFEYILSCIITLSLILNIITPASLYMLPFLAINSAFLYYLFRRYMKYRKLLYEYKLESLKE